MATSVSPLLPDSLFEAGLFDTEVMLDPFEPVSDAAAAKKHLAQFSAVLSSSPPTSYSLPVNNTLGVYETGSASSAWEPLQSQQQAAFAALMTQIPVPGLSPPRSSSSSYTTSPPSTPSHHAAAHLQPWGSPTRGVLRSPSSAGARFTPIGGSPRARRASSVMHEDWGTPRSRRATVGPSSIFGNSQLTPKSSQAAANACIPEPRPRLAPPPPSPTLRRSGSVDLNEALKALDLLDAFIQERLHLENEANGATIKLVTHEGFHAIEQLRGRVAASLQMEKLRKGRPLSFNGNADSTPSSATSSCSGSESS